MAWRCRCSCSMSEFLWLDATTALPTRYAGEALPFNQWLIELGYKYPSSPALRWDKSTVCACTSAMCSYTGIKLHLYTMVSGLIKQTLPIVPSSPCHFTIPPASLQGFPLQYTAVIWILASRLYMRDLTEPPGRWPLPMHGRLKKYIYTIEKVRVMFSLVGIFRTSRPQTAFQVILRELLWGGEGGARLYKGFATKGRKSEHQKIIVN